YVYHHLHHHLLSLPTRRSSDLKIDKLPSLNKKSVKDSDLSPETKQDIMNVIEVTEAYDEDLDKDDEIFGEEIQELIEHLQDNGITMEDTVEISDSNKDPVKFQLHDIPEEFKIDNLKIYLDDKEIYNNGDVSDEDEIILETDVKG